MFVQALQQSNYTKYKYKLNDGMSNVTKNMLVLYKRVLN